MSIFGPNMWNQNSNDLRNIAMFHAFKAAFKICIIVIIDVCELAES